MIEFRNKVLNANLGQLHIFSTGQAGFALKTKTGKLIGIDLYLSDVVEDVESDHVGYKRLLPKILNPKELEFDVVICTHFHRDHFDIGSVPQLMDNNHTKLYCAYDCEDDVISEHLPLDRVTFVKPGDEIVYDDIQLKFINCDHGQGAPLAVGVVVKVDNKVIVEVGDTCLRLDRKEEYNSLGKVDVLIAPINGMYGNMNSKECAMLTDCIKPKIVIPCHYGMFAAHMGSVGEFHKIMDEDYPNNKYLIMGQGEELIL